MPPSLALLLRDYREQVEKQRLLLGKPLTDTDFVFARPDGMLLDTNTVTHLFRKGTQMAGLGGLRSLWRNNCADVTELIQDSLIAVGMGKNARGKKAESVELMTTCFKTVRVDGF
jgi:hypothetical protein